MYNYFPFCRFPHSCGPVHCLKDGWTFYARLFQFDTPSLTFGNSLQCRISNNPQDSVSNNVNNFDSRATMFCPLCEFVVVVG